MCGRFTLYADIQEIFDRFDIGKPVELDYQPRYNIAPSQSVLAVIHSGVENRIGFLKWGLIPSWAKEESIGNKLINARAESITEKPSFKQALLSKRCIILANGFYEWQQTSNGKRPVLIYRRDQQIFGMAGLWDRWISADGKEIVSCTIITTEANDKIKPIHNRMPVILTKDNEQRWLDRSNKDVKELTALLAPIHNDELQIHNVSNLVNSPKNDRVECMLPSVN